MLQLVNVNDCIMRRQITKKMCYENAMHLTLDFTRKTFCSLWKTILSLLCVFPLFQKLYSEYVKAILSTSCAIFSYPKLLSISVLIFIKWWFNTELLTNTLRNVVFSTKKADHRYRKLINYALTWARPTLFIYLFLCQ